MKGKTALEQFLEAESAYRVLNEPRDESRVDEEVSRGRSGRGALREGGGGLNGEEEWRRQSQVQSGSFVNRESILYRLWLGPF